MHLHEKIILIKSVLALHTTGADFPTICDDFQEQVKEPLNCSFVEFFHLMANLSDVSFRRDFYGNIYWMTSSKKTIHMRRLIANAKSNKGSNRRRNMWHPYKAKKVADFLPRQNSTMISRDSQENPHLGGYTLIGDDFFLEMARLEMGFGRKPGHRIHQSGMCVSGQTIQAAFDRMLYSPDKRVILNLGTVDLLHGRDALDIINDYNRLLRMLKNKGIEVIITTLPPIVNHSYLGSLKRNWEVLNAFLIQQENCVDICSHMTQNGVRCLCKHQQTSQER
ncbi:uncharacterized protein LOC132265143 isoform X2 [Phlebotomus argentipes]|uniref:uncharacterized protein LOC132265143 isoform X2 n=1 Tax=Phlebotomus argentipes TaxID=94469 RepID=UPI002892D51C|nr:uncharacterized protein LOC132265143 isoform X2 [Phlebotomus argentipes]